MTDTWDPLRQSKLESWAGTQTLVFLKASQASAFSKD